MGSKLRLSAASNTTSCAMISACSASTALCKLYADRNLETAHYPAYPCYRDISATGRARVACRCWRQRGTCFHRLQPTRRGSTRSFSRSEPAPHQQRLPRLGACVGTPRSICSLDIAVPTATLLPHCDDNQSLSASKNRDIASVENADCSPVALYRQAARVRSPASPYRVDQRRHQPLDTCDRQERDHPRRPGKASPDCVLHLRYKP